MAAPKKTDDGAEVLDAELLKLMNEAQQEEPEELPGTSPAPIKAKAAENKTDGFETKKPRK